VNILQKNQAVFNIWRTASLCSNIENLVLLAKSGEIGSALNLRCGSGKKIMRCCAVIILTLGIQLDKKYGV
jgi:hypothetical protein